MTTTVGTSAHLREQHAGEWERAFAHPLIAGTADGTVDDAVFERWVVMNMEFIKTARAKGVAEPTVVIKHAFRNACIPVITVIGLQFGQLLGGAIITETVFAWPGVATLTVESIRNQDFPVVQCAVILLALVIVSLNLIVDLTVAFIDPRIRTGS